MQTLRASDAKRVLAEMAGDEVVLKALDRAVQPPAKKPKALTICPVVVDGVVDSGDEEPVLPAPVPVPVPVEPDPFAVAAVGVAVHVDEDVANWPVEIEGCPVTVIVDRKRMLSSDRLRVKCPVHVNCGKTRATDLDVNVWGSEASSFYLGTWVELATTMEEKRHSAYRPTRADIRQYLDRR